MGAGWDLLATARITKAVQVLEDKRNVPQPLLFLNRTPEVNVSDDEIVARFQGRVFAADIISLDSKAVVRDFGNITFDRTNILKLKSGIAITESKMELLSRIDANANIPSDILGMKAYVNRGLDGLLLGIRQRQEAMIIAMHLGSYGYDSMGIKVDVATGGWGRPSDLEVTLAGTAKWDAPTTAKPLTDIFQLIHDVARPKYNEVYNRITMSTQAFNYMIATTEFQDRVRLGLNFAYATTGMPVSDRPRQLAWAKEFLGMEIELYDGVYYTQDKDGSSSSANRFLPADKIILSSTTDDGSGQAFDWANGICFESVVSGLAPTALIGGGFGGPQYGPVAYATLTDPALNPPGLSMWAAKRGFPRYHRETCSAVIDVF